MQVAAVRPEIMLLAASLDMEDSCWEERLRTGVMFFGGRGLTEVGCV